MIFFTFFTEQNILKLSSFFQFDNLKMTFTKLSDVQKFAFVLNRAAKFERRAK